MKSMEKVSLMIRKHYYAKNWWLEVNTGIESFYNPLYNATFLKLLESLAYK